MLEQLRLELDALGSPEKAKASAWFFKTGPGQYGEGDKFIGVTLPEQRLVAKNYAGLSMGELETLLESEIHEYRMVALIILVRKFKKAKDAERNEIYDFYLGHTHRINNWDLVDVSCRDIVGEHLLNKPREVLDRLAVSELIWERRIAMVSTWAFIRRGQFDDTLRIAERLLGDKHDLIHKAVGWMLREMGKRDEVVLRHFLDMHSEVMPRTALRYAIERLDEASKRRYMAKHK